MKLQRVAVFMAGMVLLVSANSMQAGKRVRAVGPTTSTAKCKDGTYTKAKKPEKGCKKHGGVAPKG